MASEVITEHLIYLSKHAPQSPLLIHALIIQLSHSEVPSAATASLTTVLGNC